MTTLPLELNMRVAKKTADPWALKYVEPAFLGDADAASSLAVALSNEKRGIFAVIMWTAKVDQAAYRAFLGDAWMHDHGWIMAYAKTSRRLAAMFMYAQFEIPASLGDTVRVWRGVHGVDLDVARTGYSWTTDRDTACWFAVRGSDPLVIVADVPRSDIAYYTCERSESEATIFKKPRATIDGDLDDWKAGFVRFEAVKQKRHAEEYPAILAAPTAA